MRTRLTHPLQIAAVSPDPNMGQIGITFCPGKKQPHAATGNWDRQLDLDLDAIVAWGSAAVVTLLEPAESVSWALPGSGRKLQRTIWTGSISQSRITPCPTRPLRIAGGW
jgi:ADP-ribosyl-[dinitrogen reductase] hydrolase